MKLKKIGGLVFLSIGILSGIITGFILYFILSRGKIILENELLLFIIVLAVYGLIFYILMMLFRPLLGIK
jgi:hypothetical protein